MPTGLKGQLKLVLGNFARRAILTAILGAFFSVPALATNFCSLTLNSSAEIQVFKSQYSKVPGNKFIELTDFVSPFDKLDGASNHHWLKRACRKGIQCDVLIVSGHFAGEFFGRTSLSLSLEDMEELSCQSECAGIFKRPKEVMLLGCNTLAGKGTRRESMDSYIDRLRSHYSEQFSHPSQIERVAAFRYLPFGLTYGDRMRRVFSETVKIYGFDAAAPTGDQAAPLIQHYVNMVGPSYEKHLMSLKKGEPNKKLARVFQGVTFVEMDQEPSAEAPVCVLQNPKTGRRDKIAWIEEKLLSQDWMSYVPTISRHFGELLDQEKHQKWGPETAALYQRLRTNRELYDKVVLALQDSNLQKLISIRFEILRLLEILGFDSERLSRNYRNMILSHFPSTKDGVAQAQQSLCTADYSPLARASLYLTDIQLLKKALGSDEEGQMAFIEIMTCLAPTAPEVVSMLIQDWSKEIKAKVSIDDSIHGQILSVISRHTTISGKQLLGLLKTHPSLQNFVIEQILAHQHNMEASMSSLVINALRSPKQRIAVLNALSESRNQDLRVQREILQLNLNKKIPREHREELSKLLEVLESTHLEIQLQLANLYLDGVNKSVGPRSLRRAKKETIQLLIAEFSNPKTPTVRKRRALRLLASADSENSLLVAFVKSALQSAVKEDHVLAGQVLNEGLIEQLDDQLAHEVLDGWRKGQREPGMARYLAAQYQEQPEVIRELLWSWRNVSPQDPTFVELKSLLESRVVWKSEVLDTVFEMIRTSKDVALSLDLIGFFRTTIVPAEYKVRVVREMEGILSSTTNAKVRAELQEVLPVLRADAGL